jgi:hypothetical protein
VGLRADSSGVWAQRGLAQQCSGSDCL